jgi:PAS domain S-box-containing protein
MSSPESSAGQYRQRAYDIVEDGSLSYDEKQDRLVELGREYLGVANGHVEKYVEGGVHEVVASDSVGDVPIKKGDRFDRSFTFCRLTAERDTSLAISDAEEEGYGDDPARRKHGISCYLGAKITVGNDLYGTVCFVDPEVKEGGFSPEERSFVELVARLLGYQLESKGYEDEIDRREEELRVKNRAIDEAPVGITIADATESDMPLVYVNDMFLETTGYGREEVIGRNCRFLQGEATKEGPVERIARGIDDEGTVTEEILNYRSDGTPFWNELTVAPIEDDDGGVSHYMGFQREVTERVRTRRLLSVISRALRHNVRNRLTAVRGLVDALLEEAETEAGAEYAERLNEVVDSLAETSEKARRLEGSIQEPAKPVTVDVSEKVESAAETLRESYPDARLTVDAGEGVRAVGSADIEEALVELGENGIRHGGETVGFGVSEEDDEVVVRVTDDGDGLPEVEKEVLRSGEETQLHHGSGIGLFLVNWLVTNVGGRVTTEDGNGATVAVRLPAVDDGDEPRGVSETALGVGGVDVSENTG